MELARLDDFMMEKSVSVLNKGMDEKSRLTFEDSKESFLINFQVYFNINNDK